MKICKRGKIDILKKIKAQPISYKKFSNIKKNGLIKQNEEIGFGFC